MQKSHNLFFFYVYQQIHCSAYNKYEYILKTTLGYVSWILEAEDEHLLMSSNAFHHLSLISVRRREKLNDIFQFMGTFSLKVKTKTNS